MLALAGTPARLTQAAWRTQNCTQDSLLWFLTEKLRV